MKTQFGVLSTADLEEGTLTFEINNKDEMVARAGEYAIVPIEELDKILTTIEVVKLALNDKPENPNYHHNRSYALEELNNITKPLQE